MVNIVGLSKAMVLAALYNHSKPQGLGWLQSDDDDMSEQEAERLLETREYFDYLKGRVIKTRISGDKLDPWGYDRDNGQGAMARAIETIR